MGQEFHVLRCFSCQTFQVHQVKKSKKWSCKMCGEKQSLLKVYGQGSGADCRRHVQKLNALRGEILQTEDRLLSVPWKQEASETVELPDEPVHGGDQLAETVQMSCWSKYLESNTDKELQEEPEEEENVYTDKKDFMVFRNANRISSRKRQRGWNTTSREAPHLHRREAKSQKREFDDALQSNPGVSWKNPPKASATNEFAMTEALTASRCSVAEPQSPLAASERTVERMMSKWARFLAPAYEGEPKESIDAENACANMARETSVEGNCRVVSARAAMFHDLSDASGSDRRDSAIRAVAGMSAPRTGSNRPTLLRSLFQTEDDFDDTL